MTTTGRMKLLPVIILALAAVAFLKIGNVWIGFSSANAFDDAGEQAPENDASSPPTELPLQNSAEAAVSIPQSEFERRILEQLAARRKALDTREADLQTREAVIAAAEKQLEIQVAELERIRDQLTALRTERAQEDEEELDAIISAYERMRPKDAAAIFNALDTDIMVKVAAGMRTQALSGVLAEMQPEKARALTVLLAERNVSAASPNDLRAEEG